MTIPEQAVARDIVERLRSSEPLPACPYDKLSPHYWTAPNNRPCPVCGTLNDPDAPDLCRGADTRIMGEAADEIERLRLLVGVQRPEDVARALENAAIFLEVGARYAPNETVDEKIKATNERLKTRGLADVMKSVSEDCRAILALPHTGLPQEGAK
jgi:hypothetical protein